MINQYDVMRMLAHDRWNSNRKIYDTAICHRPLRVIVNERDEITRSEAI